LSTRSTHAARHILVNAQGVGSTCAKDAVPHRRSELAGCVHPTHPSALQRAPGQGGGIPSGPGSASSACAKRKAKESRAEAHLEREEPRAHAKMVLSRRFPADTGRQRFTVTDFEGSARRSEAANLQGHVYFRGNF